MSNTFLETISCLKTTLDNLFDWVYGNNFKVNHSKCHLFLSPFNLFSVNIKKSSTEGAPSEKILGLAVDSNFTLMSYVKKVTKNYMPLLDVLNT